MRKPLIALGFVSALSTVALLVAQTPSTPPSWAYGVAPALSTGSGQAPSTNSGQAPSTNSGQAGAPRGAGNAPPADDGSPKHLDGSTQAFTLAQLRDSFNVADWYPGDHRAAPDIVLKGRSPAVRACGLCHYPNGKGRPENAGIAGLPVAYFTQQIADFRRDARKSAESRKTNTSFMIAIAKAMTEDEIAASAEYFGSMTWTPWIRVVETAAVPKTRLAGGMFMPLDGAETEPLGSRIIEVPEHPDRTDLRDPRSGFVAYVPVGSIRAGETLVTTGGGGRTVACTVCHGADLRGLGPVPGIAGRSPSYQVRQLYDMKAGARHGLWSDLMKAVVVRLTDDDMAAIAAYLASRPAGT